MVMQNAKNTGTCRNCAGQILAGSAYVSGGALLLDAPELNNIHDNRHRAFMNVGFHGVNSNMSDSADIEVVNDLPGGQFDLLFCSLACLRSWFTGLVDQLENDLAGQQAGSE
jgi:hypothetical protein